MRTPLQTILASIEMAGRRVARIGDGDAPEMREQAVANLAQAQRTTDRLARLVADLMDLVMLRTGKTLPLDFSDVDLLGLARSVADEHQATAGQHRISVTGSADGAVRTDPTRLERALDNLIENAVKYSPDGGDVMVEVAHADGAASITVRDQGIGIPMGELESIFETYRRASNASMMRGIGLGLSGARAVVRQLGGELTVESDEGTGSTFTIRLPTGSPAPR
jgi:signal transduction histidine kinase